MTANGSTLVVLVVDNEDDLREAMCRLLERSGLRALDAAGPSAAVAICAELGAEIDLLVTDLIMPGTSGQELAKLATSMIPELAVVYVSGLPREIALDQGLIDEDSVLVEKPFTADRLVAAAGQALGARPALATWRTREPANPG
jgi:CheY-like chemotaxis protein